MFEEVQVLTHSSIKISGGQILYFDPYEVRDEWHDADIVFVTHDHFDHFSKEDIKKVAKSGTPLVMPESMRGMADDLGNLRCVYVKPDAEIDVNGITVKTIPAYNPSKPFHKKDSGFVGYIVTMDDTAYYVAGDTDITPENQKVKCDVALVPVGGKFTMDYNEAARLVNKIEPKLAIPTHYGTVAGSKDDGKNFAKLIDKKIEVRVMM